MYFLTYNFDSTILLDNSPGGPETYSQKMEIVDSYRLLPKMIYLLVSLRILRRICRSQWSSDLRRVWATAPFLGLRVRIPARAWMSVSCKCCVLSGRGLRDWLILRADESYWLLYHWVWSRNLKYEAALDLGAPQENKDKKLFITSRFLSSEIYNYGPLDFRLARDIWCPLSRRLAGTWSLTGETNVCIYRGVRPFCGWLETGALPERQMSAYTAGRGRSAVGWNLEPYRRDKCLHIPRGEAVLRLAGNWSLTGGTNVCIYRGVRPFCGWLA